MVEEIRVLFIMYHSLKLIKWVHFYTYLHRSVYLFYRSLIITFYIIVIETLNYVTLKFIVEFSCFDNMQL